MTLAEPIVLDEVDAELSLLGTLFMAPEAFELVAGEINPDWFSDPFARYLFEAAVQIYTEGNRLSAPAVVAALPERCGRMSRGEFYAAACAAGLPPSALGGLVATIKDRWARRSLIATAEAVRADAVRFEASPYDIASDAVLALDTINAVRAGSRSRTLEQATASLLSSLADVDTLRGPTTGLLALDNKINGYRAGQLYVIAGRPGMGKSAFMVSSLRRTAQAGYGVGIFSLEMTAEEIAARAASDAIGGHAAPPYGAILKGAVTEDQKSDLVLVYNSLSGLPLHVEDASRLTFTEIASRSRKLKARFEAEGRSLAVICIDHMGLVAPSDRYRGNKVAEAGEVSGQARALAKDLNCCVVLLCQLNREVERRDDKRPSLADLRWSGEIEQDAHVIVFLYREHYYLSQNPEADPHEIARSKFKIEALVRKNRNGETADLELHCSIAHSRVRDAI